MRDYIFTTEAETTLESYVDYLLDQHAYGAAQEIRTYIELFIVRTLCLFPAMGRHIESKEIWETWIPGTRVVLWYRFDHENVTIITLWHTAQDRFS